ncbi:hypothetical protein [Spirillospora sp. NPDC047279]|uniref:hypothetical protein n=1 Tax=Spirillospora sp. NPDC047279 TaxID=3155478 RepID=UPI0033D49FF6
MSDKIPITVRQDVHIEDLAEYLAAEMPNDNLLNFVLAIDAGVAELDFTEELHRALGEVLELEKG